MDEDDRPTTPAPAPKPPVDAVAVATCTHGHQIAVDVYRYALSYQTDPIACPKCLEPWYRLTLPSAPAQ